MTESITYKGKKIMLVEECPECGGYGTYIVSDMDGINQKEITCPKCKGKKVIPIYITPKRWKEITGEDVRDDAPVWEYQKIRYEDDFIHRRCLTTYKVACSPYLDYSKSKNVAFEIGWLKHIVLAFPGQNPPPQDYRPEE